VPGAAGSCDPVAGRKRRNWSATSRMAERIGPVEIPRCGYTTSRYPRSASNVLTAVATLRQLRLVNAGIDHDAAAAVESIRRWWNALGKDRYPGSAGLLITADCGGSNGAAFGSSANPGFRQRNRLGKLRLTTSPGTSKWNRIEHRLSSYHRTGGVRSSATRSPSNSLVTDDDRRLDAYATSTNSYPKAIRISDAQMRINIDRDPFHENGTTRSRQTTPA
jgi:hypothetical protein